MTNQNFIFKFKEPVFLNDLSSATYSSQDKHDWTITHVTLYPSDFSGSKF